MIDKIEHDIIISKYKQHKLILIEPITKQTAKLRTLCKCGEEFLSRPCDVKRDFIKSCGHCNDPKIGTRIGCIEVMIYIPDKANGCRVVCQCDCGNWLKTMSGGKFNSGIVKSCGHCNDPKVGDRIGNLTIREVIPARHKGCKVICDCDCGGTWGPIKSGALLRHRSKDYVHTCGKCNVPNIGQKYNKLTVTKIVSIASGGCIVDVICDCGRKVEGIKHGVLTNNNTTSCGFCNAPQIGDKFYKLTVIDVKIDYSTGNLDVLTICECGKKYCPKPWSKVTSGNSKTCGNCQNLRNGVSTSFKALELHSMIEDIVGHKCEHNHKIGKKSFDIVDLDNKIVIEYDEYYWHRVRRDTTKREKADTALAIRNGYKMLRVRASDDLPTKKELKKAITNHFQHGIKQYTITTIGWKQMDTINDIK